MVRSKALPNFCRWQYTSSEKNESACAHTHTHTHTHIYIYIYAFVSGNFWVRGQLEHRTENEKLTLIRILRESYSDGSFQHHGACKTLVLTELIVRIVLSLNGLITNNSHLGGASSARLNELASCSWLSVKEAHCYLSSIGRSCSMHVRDISFCLYPSKTCNIRLNFI